MARLGADARRLLDGANYGHLATLMADGSPKVDPVWVGREDDRVLVTTDAKSIKALNAARDDRVALSVTSFDNPYEQLLLRGRVIEIRDDPELVAMDSMSEKYLGGPFPRRKWSRRVVLVIAPTLARYYQSSLRHGGSS
jgi:PPOX class probable F420-dependent enzyme